MNGRQTDTVELKRLRDKSPGPGMYNTAREIGTGTTSVTILGKDKWRPINANPGPCEYNSSKAAVHPKTPKFDMAKIKARTYKKRDNTPSGGSYNPYKTFGSDITGVTIGMKQNYKSRNNNPAPGQYDPRKEVTMASTLRTVDYSKSPIDSSRLKFAKTATSGIQGVSYEY